MAQQAMEDSLFENLDDFEGDDRGDNLGDTPESEEKGEPNDRPEENPESSPDEKPEPESESEGEAEPAAEETAETPGDEDPQVPAKDDKDDKLAREKNIRIPKYRFDAMAARARAAEQKLRELEEKSKPQEQAAVDPMQEKEARIVAIDGEYAAAVADGDRDKAAQLRSEQRRLEREVLQHELTQATTQTRTQTLAEAKFDQAVTYLESTYEILNPESDNFNQEMVDELLDLQTAYVAKGYTPADALYKAAGYVLRDTETEAKEETPAPKPAPEKRKTDVRKNADAAKRTPPSLNEAGLDSPKAGITKEPDVDKMTDEEFDALPEDTRRRLRGDFIG